MGVPVINSHILVESSATESDAEFCAVIESMVLSAYGQRPDWLRFSAGGRFVRGDQHFREFVCMAGSVSAMLMQRARRDRGFQRAIIYGTDNDRGARAFEIRAGEQIEFSPDELHDSPEDARKRVYRMIEAASDSGDKRVSIVPYAVLVPVLVVMAHNAWGAQEGGSFSHNALLAGLFHPAVLGVMGGIALISFYVIRPFARRTKSRWVAFLACVLGFTIVIESLMPKLAE